MGTINTCRPIFTVEDQQCSFVFKAIVLLFTIDVLEAVYTTVVDYSLLVPEPLGEGRILLVFVYFRRAFQRVMFWFYWIFVVMFWKSYFYCFYFVWVSQLQIVCRLWQETLRSEIQRFRVKQEGQFSMLFYIYVTIILNSSTYFFNMCIV